MVSQLRMSLSEVKGTKEEYMLADSERGLQVFVRETIAAVIIVNWFCRSQVWKESDYRMCKTFSHGDGFSMTHVQLKAH